MLRAFVLTAIVLLTAAGSISPSAAGPAIENTEKEQYLNQLKIQHATSSERTALLAQVNSLLNEHALLKGYQVGQPQAADWLYSVRIAQPGTLLVRLEQRHASGAVEVSSQLLQLYGITPFFSYSCERSHAKCNILHESRSEPLLQIIRRPEAASELSRALSYLVRELQR